MRDAYRLAMSLPDRLTDALNRQVTIELASSVAYIQLSAYFAAEDLPGMASWMQVQASEERDHADRFIQHIVDRGGFVRIGDIEGPDDDVRSPLGAFQAALAHEKKVSESIRELYRLSMEVGDIDSIPLLQWFVAEQIEEEASVGEIISKVERVGEDGSALLILDQELGKRTPGEEASE